MKNSILSIVFIVLALFSAYSWYSRSGIAWEEGQVGTSPDKRWCLYLESGTSGRHYARISLFDTQKYPTLTKEGAFPSMREVNNATARYVIPAELFARATEVSWSPSSVTLKQEPLNAQKAIAFRIDLNNFSLTAVDAAGAE